MTLGTKYLALYSDLAFFSSMSREQLSQYGTYYSPEVFGSAMHCFKETGVLYSVRNLFSNKNNLGSWTSVFLSFFAVYWVLWLTVINLNHYPHTHQSRNINDKIIIWCLAFYIDLPLFLCQWSNRLNMIQSFWLGYLPVCWNTIPAILCLVNRS